MGDEPKVKIGLEIHGYLDVPSKTKLFCNCSLQPEGVNTSICPVCTGQPGAKPMKPNREAVEAIVRIALFFGCTLNPELLWQRKHYSWPDLPKGYQNTMSGAYSKPVGLNGSFLGVGIEEIHLEEDPARWDPLTGGVDYNRSGYPLIEIVTKPDFVSAEQAREWLENLMVALSYLKAVKRNLGVKCDVNVSIAPSFIRTEVKNVNSFTAIERAIIYEIKRQQEEEIMQQTRAWDEASATTLFMRSKETALDYMFIPDPDLPVIELTDEIVEPLKESLPERPDQKLGRYLQSGVGEQAAKRLSANLYFAHAAEEVSGYISAVPLAFVADRFVNEIAGSSLATLLEEGEEASAVLRSLAEITEAFNSRNITNLEYKELIEKLSSDATEALRELHTITQSKIEHSDLGPLVEEAISAKPEAASDVRAGKEKAINALVGYVLFALKKQGKSADPAEVQSLIKETLNNANS